MSELRPLKEYLFIEAWEYEDSGVGWKIRSANGEEIDQAAMRGILLEMAEKMLETHAEPVVFSTFLHQCGSIHCRKDIELETDNVYGYVWLRASMWMSFRSAIGHPSYPGWRRKLWAAEFYAKYFLARLSALRTGLWRRVAPGRPPVLMVSAEPSKAVLEAPEQPAKVLPFRRPQ